MIAKHPKRRLWALQPSRALMEPEKHTADPLAAAMIHNSHSLILSRMPEELLLQIMDNLDPVSIFCLRRTSRTFLRLFNSQSFKELHDKEEFFKPGPWAGQKLPRGGNWSEMARLLRKDTYCASCQVGWAHSTFLHMQYMHCSACNLDHTATLFSAAQRNESRAKRVCIGHEGHVRICEHKTVQVDEISRWPRLRRFACYHHSHVPDHHLERGRKAIRVFPTLDVGIYGPGQVTLSHTSHLDLLKYGEEAITAETFRAHIRELRKGPAGHIVPEYAPGILPELRAFDPTRCGCLLYPGLQHHQGDCNEHIVSRSVFSRVSEGQNTIEISFASCELGGRCLKVTHTRTIHFRTGMRLRRLSVDAPERVRGDPCDPRWKLARARDASAGAMSYNWYGALDPASYNLALDRESYRITWCDDPRCFNYYGYLDQRAIRGQRVNARCEEGCERVKKFYKLLGRCSVITVPVKNNAVFTLHRGAVWADVEWRPGLAASEVIEDPPLCTIL